MTDEEIIALAAPYTSLRSISGHEYIIAVARAVLGAQPVPMPASQIEHLWETRVGMPTPKYPLTQTDVLQFARAIERHHGIGTEQGKQEGDDGLRG